MSEKPSTSTAVLERVKTLWADPQDRIAVISFSITGISQLITVITGIWGCALLIQEGTAQQTALGAITITFIVIAFVFVVVGLIYYLGRPMVQTKAKTV